MNFTRPIDKRPNRGLYPRFSLRAPASDGAGGGHVGVSGGGRIGGSSGGRVGGSSVGMRPPPDGDSGSGSGSGSGGSGSGSGSGGSGSGSGSGGSETPAVFPVTDSLARNTTGQSYGTSYVVTPGDLTHSLTLSSDAVVSSSADVGVNWGWKLYNDETGDLVWSGAGNAVSGGPEGACGAPFPVHADGVVFPLNTFGVTRWRLVASLQITGANSNSCPSSATFTADYS